MDILMAAIAFSETLRDTPAKQNPSTTTEETVERLMPDARKRSSKSTESDLRDCVAWMWGTKVRGPNSPDPICYLSDTDIARVSEPQHPVHGSGGEGNLSRLSLVCARAKDIADQALVAADRRLDLGPQIVAASLLPSQAAACG
jgi:hypothetical protein